MEIIACTLCKRKLDLINEELHCDYCNIHFKIWNDIPLMLNENTSFDPDEIPRSIKYHLRELEASQDVNDDRHMNPYFKNHHKTILDIGCGIGQSFVGTGIYNDNTRKLFGIDIDIGSLNYGKTHYDNINFINGSGDNLPIVSNSIDFVISRVSLPYVNIPIAMKEIHRVLKINGELWMTLHPFSETRKHLWRSIVNLEYKDVIFRNFVIMNGLILHYFGKLIPFPINGKYESFQTIKAMRALLKKQNFGNIETIREAHFLVMAVKKS